MILVINEGMNALLRYAFGCATWPPHEDTKPRGCSEMESMRSVAQDASLALFDSLRTSQKSDSSAKINFASVSLPLGISIAVGRGRAVSAGQRNVGRCCTSQRHYSFAKTSRCTEPSWASPACLNKE